MNTSPQTAHEVTLLNATEVHVRCSPVYALVRPLGRILYVLAIKTDLNSKQVGSQQAKHTGHVFLTSPLHPYRSAIVYLVRNCTIHPGLQICNVQLENCGRAIHVFASRAQATRQQAKPPKLRSLSQDKKRTCNFQFIYGWRTSLFVEWFGFRGSIVLFKGSIGRAGVSSRENRSNFEGHFVPKRAEECEEPIPSGSKFYQRYSWTPHPCIQGFKFKEMKPRLLWDIEVSTVNSKPCKTVQEGGFNC